MVGNGVVLETIVIFMLLIYCYLIFMFNKMIFKERIEVWESKLRGYWKKNILVEGLRNVKVLSVCKVFGISEE